MLSINLNSIIVNATPVTSAREQYQLGQDRFHAGEPRSACTSTHQRNGWHSALNAAADSETYAYLSGGTR